VQDCKETNIVLVLIQPLAVVFRPPGDNNSVSGVWKRVRLAVRLVLPGGVCNVASSEALRAWRYASPVRWSGGGIAWRHVSPTR